ncbi:hypothetical protein [Piscinibacter sakaiensis]|uniref:hypothetical protein n=1 Tax=Piscinibacter sakaiensis TaxID=1547922 RepID=UPI003AAEC47C
MSADAWPEIQSTKLDAARRQLETAISLLFAGGDAISTHTLAFAAFGILKDVAADRCSKNVLAVAEALAAAGKKGEFWKGFNRAGNFFKHADRDPDAVILGMPEEENEALISIALSVYDGLGCIKSVELQAFSLWWSSINFEGIDDVKEPFVSWLTANHGRLHADTRSELLELGQELLHLLNSQSAAGHVRNDA